MKIYHFYHVWADGKWQLPVKEHVEYLKKSGLIDNIIFKVGLVGKRTNRLRVKEYLMQQKIKFEICTQVEKGFEHETLDKIVELDDNDDAYVFYAHSKGAYNNVEFEHEWRNKMNISLISNWKKCLEQLKDNVSIVGYHYAVHNNTLSEFNSDLYFKKYKNMVDPKDWEKLLKKKYLFPFQTVNYSTH